MITPRMRDLDCLYLDLVTGLGDTPPTAQDAARLANLATLLALEFEDAARQRRTVAEHWDSLAAQVRSQPVSYSGGHHANH